ncbi:hypothetical protein M0D21_12960 [Aquimarina sp. D1M17]|uniref:hypothetical protein n=1 Tax=Aquimarina acroporae TaxID=2937283 RepID=UPI0020BDA2E4|nr:hypothetical protein [Aquimarina acroporae]MCK8522487.1 hypothetical protein [Aquimarina acroporae]
MNSAVGKYSIKSVNIRSTHIKRRLLMSFSTVAIFESFLKENIGTEVLVINTNIGMEVYYYAKNDYSTFIKESVLLYTIKNIDQSKLKFKYHLTRDEVYLSFCEALMTFAQYPQIFLAYSKKFIHLKRKHVSSIHVIPILNGFFEEVLQSLSKTGYIPHYEKIERVKNRPQKTDPDKVIIKNLISEILMKKHLN